MKKREFVKLSQVNLPLDELKLEDNDLVAIKGGFQLPGSGSNCNCSCTSTENPGKGDNCNCSCGS